MADISYTNNNSPTSRTDVWFETYRDGAKVIIKAIVEVTLLYSSGYFNYDGEINFNMWTGENNASVHIKEYYDRWSVGTDRTRRRECTLSFESTGSNFEVGCNVTVPAGHVSIAMPNQYKWLTTPEFESPTAPTWCNINPNPCGIDNKPLITWGGAKQGSLGVLAYDVQVRSSRPSGGWTNWLQISDAQEKTSYQEVILRQMSVHGQAPFLGVKYQYRIRSTDKKYSWTGWIESNELSVSFNNPTAPTSYTLSPTSVKKDGEVKISWSGANGGSGGIDSYQLQYRIYNKNTSQWSPWILGYQGASTNYTFKVPNFYGIQDGTYFIKVFADNSFVISVKGASNKDGANIIIYKNENHDNQKFNIKYLGNGLYQILNVNSGKSLDVENGGQVKGTNVLQWTYNGGYNQQWVIRKNVDNSYTFLSQANWLALDIDGGTIENDRNIQVWDDNNTNAQKFILSPLSQIDENKKSVLNNGDLIQFRIRTKNSWGQFSNNYLTTNSVTIRGNQMWIKINGTWVEGDVYFKTNNAWTEATPYIKINNNWQESI